MILKILLFLNFSPASLIFLREFPVALEFFLKIHLNGKNHLSPMGPNFEVPTETKIIHQLITNQTKMKLYLLDTYIQTPYRYCKRISKENLSIDIGTSRIKDIVAINGFLFLFKLCFVDLACKM